jgi:hypothetical protein
MYDAERWYVVTMAALPGDPDTAMPLPIRGRDLAESQEHWLASAWSRAQHIYRVNDDGTMTRVS